jgi:hypothetical protein
MLRSLLRASRILPYLEPLEPRHLPSFVAGTAPVVGIDFQAAVPVADSVPASAIQLLAQSGVNLANDPLASVAAGDFQHNGILDYAVVDPAQNNVILLLGKGDGTFQAPQSFQSLVQQTVAPLLIRVAGHPSPEKDPARQVVRESIDSAAQPLAVHSPQQGDLHPLIPTGKDSSLQPAGSVFDKAPGAHPGELIGRHGGLAGLLGPGPVEHEYLPPASTQGHRSLVDRPAGIAALGQPLVPGSRQPRTSLAPSEGDLPLVDTRPFRLIAPLGQVDESPLEFEHLATEGNPAGNPHLPTVREAAPPPPDASRLPVQTETAPPETNSAGAEQVKAPAGPLDEFLFLLQGVLDALFSS